MRHKYYRDRTYYRSIDLLTAIAVVAQEPESFEVRVCFVGPTDKVVRYAWYHGPCFMKASIASDVYNVTVGQQFIPASLRCAECMEKFA